MWPFTKRQLETRLSSRMPSEAKLDDMMLDYLAAAVASDEQVADEEHSNQVVNAHQYLEMCDAGTLASAIDYARIHADCLAGRTKAEGGAD
jgi:hypothetical protein